MYKCLDCGSEFRYPKTTTIEDCSGEYMGRSVRRTLEIEVCPDCGSEDIEDGHTCPCCGDAYVRHSDELCNACEMEFEERMSRFKARLEKEMNIGKKTFREYADSWIDRNCWR